jgi:hypothetical protein
MLGLLKKNPPLNKSSDSGKLFPKKKKGKKLCYKMQLNKIA